MPECKSLIDVLRSASRQCPDKTLLSSPDGTTVTYSRFVRHACGVARVLREQGHQRGECVAVSAESALAFFPLVFGVWLNGGTVVPVNLRYAASALESIMERVAPKYMLVDGKPIVRRQGTRELYLSDIPDADVEFLERCREPDWGDSALVCFTSGTTGISKGAELSWDAVNFNAFQVTKRLGYTDNDRLYMNTPPYYISGISHFLTIFSCMGSMVYSSGFLFGADFLKEIEACGCTVFGGAPAHVIRVVQPLTEPVRPAHLRMWIASGDHLSKEVLDRAMILLPSVRFHIIYGLSEVAGRLCIQPPEAQAMYPGSVGTPLPEMSVTIRDEEGREVPRGETGEICISGRTLMKGYFRDPELTRKAIAPYGFRTGDVGRQNEAGCVWFEGRRDDVFKSGGEKVSLLYVQNTLFTMPGVRDAAAIAEEDMVLGKAVCAFVALREGSALRKADILKFLRGKVPDNHMPKRILFVPEIPRTGSGKAIRKALAALAREAGVQL